MSYDTDLLRGILKAAVEGGASDIHIKVGSPVVFRISRQLITIDAPTPTEEWMGKILTAMVPPHARRRMDEEREVDFSYYEPGVGRFRTNVFQQRGTFALAMRYVKTQVPSFEELGLLPIIKSIAAAPRGIVLVAGTTGSGKSTTLAAMLEHINANFKKHIVTLEDPIEFVFEDNQSVVEQREIGLDTGSFQAGLKHVLRQDPDIIMVGEIRDRETASIAMQSALTGHLVFSTVHTNDAPGAYTRLLDLGVEEFLLNAALRSIVGQRLVRRLCPLCATSDPKSDSLIDEFGLRALAHSSGIAAPRLLQAHGCESCGGTGYRGRVAITEYFRCDSHVAAIPKDAEFLSNARQYAKTRGWRTLLEDGYVHAMNGVTTVSEVLRVAG